MSGAPRQAGICLTCFILSILGLVLEVPLKLLFALLGGDNDCWWLRRSGTAVRIGSMTRFTSLRHAHSHHGLTGRGARLRVHVRL